MLLHATFGSASDPMLDAFARIGEYFEEGAGAEASNVRVVTCDVIQNALPDIGDEMVPPLVLLFPPRSVRERTEREARESGSGDTGISLYYGGPDPNDILDFFDAKATVGRIPEPREEARGEVEGEGAAWIAGAESAVAGHSEL